MFTSKSSRYEQGYSIINHKGVRVTTTLGSEYENFILDFRNNGRFRIGRIPAQHENRPDLISNLFYNTPMNWWAIMEINDINDPFENLNSGDNVKIPIP